jgi:tripartite motif-containing protein 71
MGEVMVSMKSLPRSTRGGSLAKMAMTALLAVALVAMMAGVANAAPKYSMSITKGEGGSGTLTPKGLATDSAGNLYAVNSSKGQIERFDSAGLYLGKIGSSASGPGKLSEPYDVDVDPSGNIWVANHGGLNVVEFNSAGAYLRTATTFEQAIAVATDPSGNAWWLSREFGVEMNSSGTLITFLTASQFFTATDIDIEAAGKIWVGSGGLQKKAYEFTSAGKPVTSWSLPSPAGGVAADGSGNVWIAEPSACRIQKYSPTGTAVEKFGECGFGAGKLSSIPTEKPSLAVGPGGVIWVSNGTEIQKWIP